MNKFESGAQKIIPAVLVYAFKHDKVLMIRKTKPGIHQGKVNGLGGKCEVGESFLVAAVREFKEEANLLVSHDRMRFAGHLVFPDFKANLKEDWHVMVFTVVLKDHELNEKYVSIDEGELIWVPIHQLMSQPLWEGDRKFLPLVLSRTPFFGTVWYDQSAQYKDAEIKVISI